jgi:2,5-diketo-D-gluconate reductase A
VLFRSFTEAHLQRLIVEAGVVPAVNQIEMHPRLPQGEMGAVDEQLGIVTQSWSPLGRGTGLLGEPVVVEVAEAHRVSPAQAILRWHLQLGAVPLPMSSNPSRQRENLDIFGFALTDAELDAISGLATGQRLWDQDPDVHEEF